MSLLRLKYKQLLATPPILPFYGDTALWIDAADHTCFTLGASNVITATKDKSPECNHPTQATGGKQPTWTPGVLNGKPGIVFASASSQTLVLPSALYSIPNADNTMVLVSQRTSESGAATYIVNMSESTGSRFYVGYTAAAGSMAFISRTADASLVIRSGNTNTNFQMLRSRREGTTQALTVNGLTETTNANGQSENGVDGAWIGSLRDTSNYLNGTICELIMWRRSLQPAELAQVELYLSKKWGIPLYV